VELWLESLERAAGTCCKIRNVMSVLFNHARRYDLYNRNPIQWVRQSAKRRSAPEVLTSNQVRRPLTALKPREPMMVLLDVATGLWQSELFALKWKDVDFKIDSFGLLGRSCSRSLVPAKPRLHKNPYRSTII
jgi:integrase